jgi:hypothetical protein
VCGFSFHNNNKKIFLSRRITTTTPPKNKKIPFSCAFVDIGDITNNCYSVERERKKKKHFRPIHSGRLPVAVPLSAREEKMGLNLSVKNRKLCCRIFLISLP